MLNVIINNKHLNNVDKNRPVVLALSGGVDSMVLFDMLKKSKFQIVIAHVNHHKRDESIIEEQYIREMALKNNYPIEVLNYHHEKDNFQAEAHNSRYQFFYDVCKKYNASSIVTAHHYIDNLETIIMNIIRGSNIYGYAGIKECVLYDDIQIIRPLINVCKDDLYNYAKENDIKYFEDTSNASDDYLRNRIRHHVIPLLQKENPNLKASVNNYSQQLHQAFSYIRDHSICYLEKNNNKIDLSSFNKLALIQKKDIINYICDLNGILSSDNKINDILNLIESEKPNLKYDLNNNFEFIKAYNICYVSKKDIKQQLSKKINLNESLIFQNKCFTLSTEIKINNDFLKISPNEPLPLVIRNREQGDKLIIGEGHKKLKDFLIDKKVPKSERDKLILIANAEGEIIWVLGYYKKKYDMENGLILSCKETM